jgi:hypothetical protein
MLTRSHHAATNTRVDAAPTVVVPVVLPQAVVTVDDSGNARIVVETVDHPERIDCPDGPIGRDELGTVLASIAEQVGGPVRVEVREPDGSRYADILQPCLPEPAGDPERPETSADEPVVAGGGFLPEETVLGAVVVATTQAQPDGTAALTALPLPAQATG